MSPAADDYRFFEASSVLPGDKTFKHPSNPATKWDHNRPALDRTPPEILLHIFDYACSSRNAFAPVIGGVSTKWRHLVCSSSDLWAHLRINLSCESEGVPERYIHLLRLYFHRVHPSTLALELRDLRGFRVARGSYFSGEPEAHHHRFLELILREFPERIRSITWPDSIALWNPTLNALFDDRLLSGIRHIDSSWGDLFPRIGSHSFPCLTSIELYHGLFPRRRHFAWVEARFSHLTSVDLTSFFIDEVMEFLFKLPTLKSFSSRLTRTFPEHHYRITSRSNHQPPVGNMALVNLEILKLDFVEEEWTRYLLSSVHLPSLRRLQVYKFEYHRSDSTRKLFMDFIYRLEGLKQVEGNMEFLKMCTGIVDTPGK